MEKKFLEECLEKGMSLPQIGELAGRPAGTVGYWVAKHGLVANGRAEFSRKGPLDAAVLRVLIEEGRSIIEIADELGVTPARVRYWVTRYDLGPTRGANRASAIRRARAEGLNEVELNCPRHGLTLFWVGESCVRCRKCNSAGVARRRRRVKEILVAEAGGRCRICGFDQSPVALEFHHLDPTTKSFGIAAAGISRSIDASRAEAAKCVLLCANCHAQVEAGVLELAVQ